MLVASLAILAGFILLVWSADRLKVVQPRLQNMQACRHC